VKAVTGNDMGRIDKFSIEQIGISGVVLMENAALKIVKHVEKKLAQNKLAQNNIVIVAGKGNNAGDAFVVARHLIVGGMKVKLYCLFEEECITGDAKLNFDILQRVGIATEFLQNDSELDTFRSDVKKAQIVIDGIFGTGFRGQVQGHIEKVIELINKNSMYTIAIDIASGIDSATGSTADTCVQAHKTVTFELPKIGQLVYPGAHFTGELVVESIGMPRQAIESIEISTNLADSDFLKAVIPKRNSEINKGNCGKVVVVTGSLGMAGSGCIAAKASLRTGSGLVYLAGPASLINIYQSVVPEAIAINLEDDNGVISEKSISTILEMLNKCNVAAIGPGLSTSDSIYNIISSIAENVRIPVVLDADALNAVAKNIDILGKFQKTVVITPHPGEMSRLTGLDTSYIQLNRVEVARKYASLWGVVIVLKGARTIIADKCGTIYVNPTGNAGMATAGSGDALTGIIASLIGQGTNAFEAAVAGTYLHGLAGDIATIAKGEHGLNAMDIVESVPYAIKSIL
jgi:ADP-dependent NAD(P)H-hydrate dehydratase / NAD(P)H-hydrate epimerase